MTATSFNNGKLPAARFLFEICIDVAGSTAQSPNVIGNCAPNWL